MLYWPHPVTSLLVSEIAEAVSDPKWQKFRRSLKGKSTSDKLSELNWYRSTHMGADATLPRKYQVQIDNYINALKRGGQLDREAYIPGVRQPTHRVVSTPFVLARVCTTNNLGD